MRELRVARKDAAQVGRRAAQRVLAQVLRCEGRAPQPDPLGGAVPWPPRAPCATAGAAGSSAAADAAAAADADGSARARSERAGL